MRILLALILFAALPTEKAQACHRYSHWYYPTPQSCRGSPIGRGNGLKIHQVRVQIPPPAPTQQEDKSWYVEFVLPNDDNADADLREVGVEKLKKELNK